MRKVIIPLLFCTVGLKSLSAEDFKKISNDELVVVGLNNFEQSQEIMSAPSDYSTANCSKNVLAESLEKTFWENSPKKEQKQEIKCFCDIESLSANDRNLVLNFLGEIKSQSLRIDTGNDNFLHGGLNGSTLKKFDGDDRGRTFGFELDYAITGTEGEFKIGLESTGFGEMVKVGNKRKDENKRHYLNFREYNQLDLEFNKNFSAFDPDKDRERTYLATEFSFYNESDKGNLSRTMQEQYHSFAKNNLGLATIQYNYQALEPDKNFVGAKAGLGKEIFFDLKNWKCQMKGEIKVGFSQEMGGKSQTAAELEINSAVSLSHKSLPWMVLSSWLQGGTGHNGQELSYNVTLQGNANFKRVKVSPFIGVEQHFGDVDNKFGTQGGNPNELYHKLGVEFKF